MCRCRLAVSQSPICAQDIIMCTHTSVIDLESKVDLSAVIMNTQHVTHEHEKELYKICKRN